MDSLTDAPSVVQLFDTAGAIGPPLTRATTRPAGRGSRVSCRRRWKVDDALRRLDSGKIAGWPSRLRWRTSTSATMEARLHLKLLLVRVTPVHKIYRTLALAPMKTLLGIQRRGSGLIFRATLGGLRPPHRLRRRVAPLNFVLRVLRAHHHRWTTSAPTRKKSRPSPMTSR